METTLQVTDEYVRVGDRRPLELLRDFDALETVWRWGRRSEVPHALLYRTVRFTWDESGGTYSKDWDPPRGSRKALAGVWEDLDFRCLLPQDAVEVGDSWSVPLAEIAPVLLPGGSIHRDELLWDAWGLFELEDALARRSRHWFRNDDLTCKLADVLALDDRRLARVELEWEWWGWVDLFSASRPDPWWSRLSVLGAVVELEMDCSGELLWDLEAGLLHSFELDAEVDAELELRGGWGELEIKARGWARWMAEGGPGD